MTRQDDKDEKVEIMRSIGTPRPADRGVFVDKGGLSLDQLDEFRTMGPA